MTTIKHFLASAALVGLAAVPASAETIYSETFSAPWEGATNDGTGPLNGTTPGVTVGINTWTASDWRENGTAPTSTGNTSNDDSAFLAFIPTSGTIYTLSATLTQPSGGVNTGWVAIGFTGGNATTGEFFNNSAAPWMLWRPSNATAASEVRTFLGTGTTGGVGEGAFTGTATFDIVLNTQAATWTAEWFVNGVSVRSAVAVATQDITHIGLGRENGQSSTFTNFSLTSDSTAQPRITSFTAVGGGLWELTLAGAAETDYEFRSSTTLDFNPGTLAENLTKGDPGHPITIGGPNDSVVTTDASGNAMVRMTLTGDPADFVRAVSIP